MNTEDNETVNGKMRSAVKESGLQLKGTHFGIRAVFPDDLTDDALL